ncbi:MAG: DUF3006 domain-containing protein [Clostridiales bacterium]|jgi:hypothetical protein|nr:DUF3006 domain-containing protein [Clostridiales bacterium]
MLVIDRFEGDYAIVEDGNKHIKLEKKNLPPDAKESDVLIFVDGKYIIDKEQTQKNKEEIIKLQNSLWE